MANAIETIETIEQLTERHNGAYYAQRVGCGMLYVYASQKDFTDDLHGHDAESVEVSRNVSIELDRHGWIGVEGESALESAESLEDLLAIFKAEAYSGFEILSDRDLSDLPTFGGAAPYVPFGAGTVWSWDKSRLLVGDATDDMRIIDRLDFVVHQR